MTTTDTKIEKVVAREILDSRGNPINPVNPVNPV